MGKQTCDGCGEAVRIAGGIADMWSLSKGQTEGLTLELTDGSEWFLCQTCLERLPDDGEVTAEDIRDLPERA
jgi:hypothetical protein